jgi:hypothetical protein
MDYVGLDPMVGLECASCHHIVRLPYSELLNNVLDAVEMSCDGCGGQVEHNWTTVNIVQNIIRRRMDQAHRNERRTSAPSFYG